MPRISLVPRPRFSVATRRGALRAARRRDRTSGAANRNGTGAMVRAVALAAQQLARSAAWAAAPFVAATGLSEGQETAGSVRQKRLVAPRISPCRGRHRCIATQPRCPRLARRDDRRRRATVGHVAWPSLG